MPWAWVRPKDQTVLEGRPLLDLGTGDGQTLAALVKAEGLVVGTDRAPDLLQPGNVNAAADRLPFGNESFVTVLAADLFHHLDDEELASVLSEIRRVLRPGGRLVAWWYESSGRQAPDAPRHPRSYESLGALVNGFSIVERLELEMTLEPAPPTTGLLAVV